MRKIVKRVTIKVFVMATSINIERTYILNITI